MKHIALFIFTVSSWTLSAQDVSREYFLDIKSVEEDLLGIYKDWEACQSDAACDDAEKSRLNMYFADGMSALIKHNPATFDYDFKQMIDSYAVDILQSSDQKLRIYNWNAFRNTSMRDFYTIFQFRDKTGTNIQYGKADGILNHSYLGHIADLHTVNIAGKTHYFVIQNAILSSNDIHQSIECMTIENGNLRRNIPIFKTKIKQFGSIDFNFLSNTVTDDRAFYNLIVYDDSNKQILIPVVNEDMEVQKSYLIYQLTGKYFEYIGIKK